MAKTRLQHEAAIVRVIEEHLEDIDCFAGILDYYHDIGHTQFFNLKLNESDLIKKALDRAKSVQKKKLRRRWKEPDANPTLQLAAYKLMATPEEREALSTSSKVDATVKGDMNVTGRPTVQLVHINEED